MCPFSKRKPLGRFPASTENVTGPATEIACKGISSVILSTTIPKLPEGVIH